MKKIKLSKTLLIPSLGVLTLGTIAAVATSCSCSLQPTSATVVVTANADSTLELINHDNNPNLQYSTDDGTSWNTYSGEISISQGQTLLLKGNNPNGWSTYQNTYKYSNFNITGDVSLSGNIMALIDNGKGTATAAIPNEYCFYSLFRNSTGITSVSKDFLPATELADYCYTSMFRDCGSLTIAPDLPATTLANSCYFCMFQNCTSLTQAPDLPTTTLANSCYFGMFQNCTSLTQAPDLPATTLAEDCYNGMFWDCTSLTESPDLPATKLADYCYDSMFNGCSSLNSIRIGYTGKAAEAPTFAFDDWVEGVANTGTFYYKGGDSAQDFGFPNGWDINPN